MNLGYTDQLTKNFKFSTNLTFTKATNLVTETNNGLITGGGYGIPFQAVTRFEKGYAPGYFYGFKTDGLFQTAEEITKWPNQSFLWSGRWNTGDLKYLDLDNNGVVNNGKNTVVDPGDMRIVGNERPQYSIFRTIEMIDWAIW